ncbi:hypothetical protein [uncultured Bradyrhizobium sp.]|uniref:hypothetical protein n=1 Tax=uncultured Bradyrhizobium sp. TaxID=199684 RepID=UPI002634F66D|nr:hypothetical protein [uncultured Bradyrhizobium sp.]
MNERIGALVDALWFLIPFSFVGAFFGDSFRRDVLTSRQRVSAGLFALFIGPAAGLLVTREWGWHDVTGFAIAAVVPTLSYDLIVLVAALLSQLRTDPLGGLRKVWDAIAAILPGRKS